MSTPSKRVNARPEYGIIFDFDGTLALMSIDFNKMREAINKLFSRYRIQPETLSRGYILERIDEAFERVSQADPDLARLVRQEALSLIETMELKAASKSQILPGVYPRLWHLKRRGFRLAIATRNGKRALMKVTGKARILFDIILTRENSQTYKPEKTALYPILKRFSLPKERIFMVGDHPMDVKTARCVPITPICVLTGTGKKEELVEAGASLIFKHVNHAIDALLRYCI